MAGSQRFIAGNTFIEHPRRMVPVAGDGNGVARGHHGLGPLQPAFLVDPMAAGLVDRLRRYEMAGRMVQGGFHIVEHHQVIQLSQCRLQTGTVRKMAPEILLHGHQQTNPAILDTVENLPGGDDRPRDQGGGKGIGPDQGVEQPDFDMGLAQRPGQIGGQGDFP